MLTSYLIRLRADRLALGELVGELEPVATGVRVPFRDAGELLDQLRATALDHVGTHDAPPPEPRP